MLDNLSKYVYEVYRSKSVSSAAKKLFLSQPALSTAIRKAEEELGAEIFNRKTIPFSLTAEGKVYIEAIEKIMLLEEQTLERIQDISEIRGGLLNIATSTNFANYVIPKICEQFYHKFPNIDITITTGKTSELASLLTNKTADLIFIPTEGSAPGFMTIPLLEENLIIAVRKDFRGVEGLLPYALSYDEVISRNFPQEKQIKDMSLFHGLEFIYSPPDSNTFKKQKLIFGESNFSSRYISPKNLSQKLNYNLMRSGFGALLTTDADVATMQRSENCIYFALQNPAAKQSFSIAHGKTADSPAYKLVNEFINTAIEFFDCENPLKKIL